jgi:hypothetical protein
MRGGNIVQPSLHIFISNFWLLWIEVLCRLTSGLGNMYQRFKRFIGNLEGGSPPIGA